MAFNSYLETTSLLNKLYLVALLLLLAFAVLLIVFVIRLGQSEGLLLKENERAVRIARQKQDLLLHMSHEIRNPLTSINGFLYIFSRTTLTPKQSEMLGTVRASSDLLLQTLNDTLDAAKMESSELKIHQDPFCPDKTLKEVIESMAFSADKKQLELSYHFEGDTEAEVLGDSFRLKQIIVNLVSNAIKYTETGNVKIKATLKLTDNKGGLTVDIIDTGAGISQEQQVSLFSKYYQTNSAKGNTGTGLGLYICKQLIELQKGSISVKSDTGKGSTFSFEIPYEKYEID
jgi:signal transduction histidine kinase